MKKEKENIKIGMNSYGMPMFYCNCKNQRGNICDKCIDKILIKLEKIMKLGEKESK